MEAIGLPALAVIAGFAGLIWSADKFVNGSAAIAKGFGISTLIIGLTIVSFGTSAPEVVVSISAALKQTGDLAIGNALGSNIANIGLVLAATTLIASLPVQKHILYDELPVLILVTLLAGVFLYDGQLVFWEGSILLGIFLPAMIFLIKRKQSDLSEVEKDAEEEQVKAMPLGWAIFWFIAGLISLIISSEILVWGAKSFAVYFEVSPLIIGLTVVAVGTSLPELAASIASAMKGHHDIALGNIIGSNMFNLLTVMAIPGLIDQPQMSADVFIRDYGAMLLLSLLLIASMVVNYRRAPLSAAGEKNAQLGKCVGIILLSLYLAYYVLLFYTAS